MSRTPSPPLVHCIVHPPLRDHHHFHSHVHHLIKIICTHRAEEEELDILGNTIHQPDKCASEVRACEAGVPSASFPTAGEHSSWNIHLPIHHYHYQLSIIIISLSIIIIVIITAQYSS